MVPKLNFINLRPALYEKDTERKTVKLKQAQGDG